MLRLTRAARVWDLVANSGRFAQTLPVLLGARPGTDRRNTGPFNALLDLTDALHARLGRLHAVALEELAAALHADLVERLGVPAGAAADLLAADYARAGAQGRLAFAPAGRRGARARTAAALPRQARHLGGAEAHPAAPRSPER
jgi:hypothetical protein